MLWIWIHQTYKAQNVHVALPDILIITSEPPKPIPLTLGASLVRFAPPDLKLSLSVPLGVFRPYNDSGPKDLLSYHLNEYLILSEAQRVEIIEKLSLEVIIRAIHLLPP